MHMWNKEAFNIAVHQANTEKVNFRKTQARFSNETQTQRMRRDLDEASESDINHTHTHTQPLHTSFCFGTHIHVHCEQRRTYTRQLTPHPGYSLLCRHTHHPASQPA